MNLVLIPTSEQQRAIESNAVLNWSEVGSGKTLMTLERFRNEKKLLIVCLASKVNDWATDAEEQGITIVPCNGSLAKRNKVLDENNMVSISFESSWRTPKLIEWIDDDTTVVFDEAHKLANRTSKVTKFWLSNAPKSVYQLTASPVSNGRYEQLYTQLKIAGLYNGTWTSFKKRYCVETFKWIAGRKIFEITSYKNQAELRELCSENSISIKRNNKLVPTDLLIKSETPKMFKVLKQTRTYQKDNGEIRVFDNPSETFNALRIASNGFINGVAKIAKNAKYDRLRDLLEEIGHQRVVIVYQYNETRDRLIKLMGNRPTSVYCGETKDLTNWETYDNTVLLVQCQSGSTGVNFMGIANTMVFFELPLSSIHYIQMKGRITRHTSKSDPIYYHMVGSPIDQRIYDTLMNGQDVTNTMIEEWVDNA